MARRSAASTAWRHRKGGRGRAGSNRPTGDYRRGTSRRRVGDPRPPRQQTDARIEERGVDTVEIYIDDAGVRIEAALAPSHILACRSPPHLAGYQRHRGCRALGDYQAVCPRSLPFSSMIIRGPRSRNTTDPATRPKPTRPQSLISIELSAHHVLNASSSAFASKLCH
jgi:hypothetical protein